jgi:hypothetical protein
MRMAEFLVLGSLNASSIKCIIVKEPSNVEEISGWVDKAGLSVPVLVRPGCYF